MKDHRSRPLMTPEPQHVVPCGALPDAAARCLRLLSRFIRHRQLGGEGSSGAHSRPQTREPTALRRMLGSCTGGHRGILPRVDGGAAEQDGTEVHPLSPALVQARTRTHAHTRQCIYYRCVAILIFNSWEIFTKLHLML